MRKENLATIEHLYIHYPFCEKKCGYCSFYSRSKDSTSVDRYFLALKQELEYYQKEYNLNLKTLYIGGGTPSLMTPFEIRDIINQFNEIQEITIEINPADVTLEKAEAWFKSGVNRISMGCQSAKDSELKFLGRRHDSKAIKIAYMSLRKAGFKNVSLDLIYGLPGQQVEDVIFSLQKLVELSPEHISTYCLSLDNDCSLANWQDRLPDDDLSSDMYYVVIEELEASGFEQYEISNFCRKGRESKHNLAYWDSLPYLGCGPAAAGNVPGFRYINIADIEDWSESMGKGEFYGEKDVMTREKEILDYIMLSLRLIKGLDLEDFYRKFNFNFMQRYDKLLARYFNEELMVIKNNRISLTRKALFISNAVISGFFDDRLRSL